MRRTVLLACPYFPPHIGGVESYVWNLARQLQRRHGYRVLIATTADPGTAPGRCTGPDDIPVYRLRVLARFSNTPFSPTWQQALRTLIAAHRVDLVNAHAPVPLFADAAARANSHVPFVLTYHTGRMRHGNRLTNALLAAYERTVLTGTVRRAQELICCSDYVAADQPRLFASRATTISPGVDLTCFTPAPLVREPRLLFVGSLEPATAYKGLDQLLRAVAQLAPDCPVGLTVVGAGSALNHYADLAVTLGISDRVEFAGRLEGAELAQAYQRARVLALPTAFESFGSVLAEAMACGRPVVTTPVGGIPSLVTHRGNGLLVPPGDVDALASALGELLRDDVLARRLGQVGHARVTADLSWDRQADRTAFVFERALAQ
ncbi:glycosyltransferase family 4 protein (plasmid) [Kitasatospora sp. NBC_00070]|uniref:glycosyltransferase family 4 protein n=1 Tax=Kitasatospora sp. NBC_00070 TaxID=2975962 RepID=UPI002F9199D4